GTADCYRVEWVIWDNLKSHGCAGQPADLKAAMADRGSADKFMKLLGNTVYWRAGCVLVAPIISLYFQRFPTTPGNSVQPICNRNQPNNAFSDSSSSARSLPLGNRWP